MTQDDEKAVPSEPQIPATFMLIDTNATNSDDGGFWIPQKDHVNIHDTITYSGATVGATYTVTGEVHSVTDDGKDGGIAKDSTGTPITAQCH